MDLPVLHNWTYVEPWKKVFGSVYNSKKFPAGKQIQTSRVISINREECVLTTKNSTYLLGSEYNAINA